MAKNDRKQSGRPGWGGVVAGVVAGAAVMALVFWAAKEQSPTGVPMQSAPPPAPPAPIATPAGTPAMPDPSEDQLAAAERISAAQAKSLLDAGQAVALDVRDVESFKAGHIPGALQIPLQYVQGEIPYMPRDKKIITYCT